jgi:hypothetical protein
MLMSNNEPDDESTTDSQQESEQQPAEGDQPSAEEQPAEQVDDSTEQAEEQPSEGDQSAEQAEEPAVADDQATEPSQEQPADSDLPTNQADEQAAESDQTTDQSGDPTGEGGGGSGSGGGSASGGPADDAVPAAGGGGGHKLKVIAEFIQEGKPFIGDIKILLLDYDKNGVSSQVWDQGNWQNTTTKGNVVTTPLVRFTTSEVAITADARIDIGYGNDIGNFQMIGREFVFPMPSGDTLRTKFEIEIRQVDETVSAPDADHAKGKVFQMPKFKGKFVSLDAQALGNQKFHVTGKYATGSISSPDGRPL